MTDLSNRKPILCLDFDGVCHSYTSGWKGATVIPDKRVDGLFEFIIDASKHFIVSVFSSRSGQGGGIRAMRQWFIQQYIFWYNEAGVGLNSTFTKTIQVRPTIGWAEGEAAIDGLISFPTEKPPAFVGIDDRILTFKGQWPAIEELKNFKPWNAKHVCSVCGIETDYCCADCRIDKKISIYVCGSSDCRDKHEAVGCTRIGI